jgi:hypothetical protein
MNNVYDKIMIALPQPVKRKNDSNMKRLGMYNGMPAKKLGMYNMQTKRKLGFYN